MIMLGEHCTPQVLRAHLLSQKINKFSHIADQIRRELVKELGNRKVLDPRDLERQASMLAGQVAENLGELGLYEPDEVVAMQHNSLVDLYAAQELNDDEIEEIINLTPQAQTGPGTQTGSGQDQPQRPRGDGTALPVLRAAPG